MLSEARATQYAKMINAKIINLFMRNCEEKMAEHQLMLTIIKDLASSSKQLSKSFGKLIKKVQKDTTFYLYCDANTQLDTRTFSNLSDFTKQFEKNLKDQQATIKKAKKPYEKQMKIYAKLESKEQKDEKTLKKAEATVYEKNAAVLRNKNEKTEANLAAAQQKFEEAKKVYEQSKADNQREVGNTQQLVNETAKVLQQVFQKLLQFEKAFYEKASNYSDAQSYFDRLTKVHEEVKQVDPQASTEKYIESINLKSIIRPPVFKLEPAAVVKEAAQKQAETQPRQEESPDKMVASNGTQGTEEAAVNDVKDTEQVFQKDAQ